MGNLFVTIYFYKKVDFGNCMMQLYHTQNLKSATKLHSAVNLCKSMYNKNRDFVTSMLISDIHQHVG